MQLFTEYLSAEETETIESLLSNNQYKVVLNDLAIPLGLQQSTVIYSPLNRDINKVNELFDLLETTSLGVPKLELTGKENHFYTNKAIGLYLLPEHIVQRRLADKNNIQQYYVREYNGRCESQDANLILIKDGSLLLVGHLWDDDLQADVSSSADGRWSYSDHTIFLSLGNSEPIGFSVTRREVEGETGYREIRLQNKGDVPFYDGCNFVYRALIN